MLHMLQLLIERTHEVALRLTAGITTLPFLWRIIVVAPCAIIPLRFIHCTRRNARGRYVQFGARSLPMRPMNTILITLLIAIPSTTAVAIQKTDTTKQILSNSVAIQLDSLKLIISKWERERVSDQKYLDIIQKTNDQLGLWTNPYGIMIAALGVLFGVLAIVATFIIFRQNAAYRSMINESIMNYQTIINKFLDEKRIELQAKMKELTDRIATAEGDSKTKLLNALDELKQAKEEIDRQVSFKLHPVSGYATFFTPPLAGYSGYSSGSEFITEEKVVTCPHCGTKFTARRTVPRINVGTSASWFEKCPQCHQDLVI